MRTIGFAAALALAWGAHAHDAEQHATATQQVEGPADGWVFPLAAPGTYGLPPIKRAADAMLLDEAGRPVGLSELYDGRITLLAFIYTRCADICPLATTRLADLQSLASADPELAGALRLASLSFDPEHDTPERMAAYAAAFRAPQATPDWMFLTAPNAAAIAPVLAAYDQPVGRKADPDDGFGPFSHLLRVFLVDPDGVIRNIYSADFLDPRLVVNDAKTLLMEVAPRLR
jgi:protein SCO1